MNIRHGEVFLRKIEKIPDNAKLVFEGSEYIAGHSESGHHHVITADVIKCYEVDGKTFLDIPKVGKLTHQKSGEYTHGTQTIQGVYERIIKRKFNPYTKLMEKVRD